MVIADADEPGANASETATLTKNQKAAHPSIEQSGGTVVGKGKPGYEGHKNTADSSKCNS